MKNTNPVETPKNVDDLVMPANPAPTSERPLLTNQVDPSPSSKKVSDSLHQKRVVYETIEEVEDWIRGKRNKTRIFKDMGIRWHY